MSRASIESEINKYESMLSSSRNELGKLKEKLRDVNEFKAKFNSQYSEFTSNMGRRKKKTATVSYMANNIKCAKKYYDKMNNLLNSAHYNDIESKISDMASNITSVITDTEMKISNVEGKIRSYESTLSSLRSQLASCED